ncbi:MAG: alanine racemase [Pseudoflavonifractor sp.]|nr:alanine racemase [Pseudoflavonifractor sp.]
MEHKRYPRLICDLSRLRRNVEGVTERCHAAGIRVAGVIKGANGRLPITEQLALGGCDQIASSRLDQLERASGLGLPTMLIRTPMFCELEDVACVCDYSLESDSSVLTALNALCAHRTKRHKVVLMADLGDLREGWWDKNELVAQAVRVERELPHLELAGIGTNFGCYGGIIPTVEKMKELIALADRIESAVGRKLEIVSGGATTAYRLVHKEEMPDGINHLRIGEAMLVDYDLPREWGVKELDYLSSRVFLLQAQVLECRVKPSCPVGEVFIDSFGSRPEFPDHGMRRKALIGVGKLDLGSAMRLVPLDKGIRILGSSSDHTFLDVEDCPRTLAAGDILEFELDYTAMLFLTAGSYVAVDYLPAEEAAALC